MMPRPLDAMTHMISDKASHALRVRSLHMDCSFRAEQGLGQYRDDNFHEGYHVGTPKGAWPCVRIPGRGAQAPTQGAPGSYD